MSTCKHFLLSDILESQDWIVTWGEMLMSGQAAFLAILILSEREEVAAWAQQLPQY